MAKRKSVHRALVYDQNGIVGFRLDAQEYRFLRLGFYENENGIREVAFYETRCTDCGTSFEVFVPTNGERPLLANRRCGDCRQPGIPVKSKTLKGAA